MKKIIIILVIVFLGGCASVPKNTVKDISYFNNKIKQNPGSIDAFYKRALFYNGKKNYKAALIDVNSHDILLNFL